MKSQKYQVKVTFSCNRKTSPEKMTIKEGVENSRFMSLTVNKLSTKSRSSLVIIGSDYDTEFDIDDVELCADNVKDLKIPDTYTKEEYQALQEQSKLLEKENRELKKSLDALLATMKSAISKAETLRNPSEVTKKKIQVRTKQVKKVVVEPQMEVISETIDAKDSSPDDKIVRVRTRKAKNIS